MKKFTIFMMCLLASVFLQAQTINTFPWTESFEQTTFPPTGWEIIDNGINEPWKQNDGTAFGPGSVADGAQAASFNCYGISESKTASLITPALDLSGLSNAVLSFSIQCKDDKSKSNAGFRVEFSTDGGANYAEIYRDSADGRWDNWTEVKINLPSLSPNCKIKFTGVSDYGYKNLFLDKIKLYQPAPMVYETAEVFQNNTDVVYTGALQNELIGIKLHTKGNLTPLSLDKLLFSLNGTTQTSDVTKLQLFYTGGNAAFSTDSLVGEKAAPFSGNIELLPTGTFTLNDGDNYFWLTADVAPDAKGGNLIDAECKSLTVNAEEKTPNPTAPTGNREIKQACQMVAGSNEMIIGSEYLFYDDGGPAQKYSEGFEGTITFKPKDPNQKIKIDWDKFRVFVYQKDPTTAWSKNDIFKVYNGSAIDESKLIDRYYGYSNPTGFQKENVVPTSIISTAPDGALTVYFKVNTGMPDEGWEAKVTQVPLADMTYSASEVVNCSENESVASEDTVVKLLKLAVTAENTENPIKITKIILNLDGTDNFSDFSKFCVYATGVKQKFSNAHKVGELTGITGNMAEITFTAPDALQHGTNYYWITCDVAAEALHGNLLKTKIAGFEHTASGATVVPDKNASLTVTQTIDNTYVMPVSGTHIKTIGSKIGFVDSGGADADYKAEKSTATVTFIPKNPGEKIKMLFPEEDFGIYFSPYSWGASPVFEIYNGDATSSDLVWKADKNNKDKGPGEVKSKAADGSITIKFNAKTTSTSSVRKGWKAEIWSERPVDMAFESNTTEQITGVVTPGSGDQQILKMKLTLKGELNPITETKFVFGTEGTTRPEDIAGAKLFFTGANENFIAAEQVGATVNTPNGEFSFTASKQLAEGDNYFWLLYDIAAGAVIDDAIDARLIKIKLGNAAEQIIADGNPAGNRIVKNVYLMPTGKAQVLVSNDTIDFYDDGGPDNKYSKNFNGTVTFKPATPGEYVALQLNLLQLGGYSATTSLTVYDGETVTKEKEMARFGKSENFALTDPSVFFKSTDPSGALTVHFKSYKTSSPLAGWASKVVSFVPKDIAYDSAWAEQASAKIWRGAEGVILKIPLKVKGEKNSVNVEELILTTEGTTDVANIAKAKLYTTDTIAKFDLSMAQFLGETSDFSGTTFSLPCAYTIDREETKYLWLCFEITSDAQANNEVDAVLKSIKAGGITHAITSGNPTGAALIEAGGMKGLYTIDPAGSGDKNFLNFSAAVDSLTNKGIEAAVTFKIADGTYTEKVKIPHIQGTSEKNTIVFEAASGEPASVIIQSNDYQKPPYGSQEKTGIFHFDGADFISLKNVTVQTENKSFDGVVVLTNESRRVSLENCIVNAPKITSNSDQVNCLYTYAKNEANKNNDYLSLKENKFNGGYIGLNIGGTGYVKLPKEKGLELTRNTCKGQYSKSIYIRDEKDALIEDNTIINETTSNTYGFQGMDLYRLRGNSKIANNLIALSIRFKCVGIECRGIEGTSSDKILIYNNAINNLQAKDIASGILLDDKCTNTDLFYNTVCMQGNGAPSTRAFAVLGRKSEIPENITVKNNIFVNNAGGYALLILKDLFKAGFDFDFNNIYASGAALAKLGSNDLADFAAWQTNFTAANSHSDSVEFYTATDLHIKVGGNLTSATPLSFITKDKEGVARDAAKPTFGAYEFTSPSLEAPVFAQGYPEVKPITHKDAQLKLSSESNANAYWVLLPKEADQPTIDQIKLGQDANGLAIAQDHKGKIDLLKNNAQVVDMKSLDENKNYAVYVVLENNVFLDKNKDTLLIFKTLYRPSEPSTFEEIAAGSDDFLDKTARFLGVKVLEQQGAFPGSNKYASVEANSTMTITLDNTDKELPVKGFFINNEDTVTVIGYKADSSPTDTLNIPGRTEWDYIELTGLDSVKTIVFQPCVKAYSIDDFNADPQPLKVLTSANPSEIKFGDTTLLECSVSGGVKPYTYSWIPSAHAVDSATAALIKIVPQYSTEYTLTVTDAQGKQARHETFVNVTGNVGELDFEEVNLPAESYWKPSEHGLYSFYSKGFQLKQSVDYIPDTWKGFTYSNKTNKDVPGGLSEQWTSAPGKGAEGSENYGVAYIADIGGERINIPGVVEDTLISGMYVTNNTWAVASMKNGDAFAKKFGGSTGTDQDWFKLTITGFDKDYNKTSSVDVYLADYRFDNSAEDYILTDWKWVDLTPLGEVKQLKFELFSSDKDSYGRINTPAYFCFDNLNAIDEAPVVLAPVADINRILGAADYPIDLSGIFSDPDGDSLKITVTANSNDSVASAMIQGETMKISFKQVGETRITLQAEAKGKIVETSFTVTVEELAQALTVATFEEQTLDPESYFKPTIDGQYSFVDGGFEFIQRISYGGTAWSGITYSNKTNKDVPGGVVEQWTSAAGKGADDSPNYAVVSAYGDVKVTLLGEDESSVTGMFVTNNTYAATSMENGDSYAKKFGGSTGTDEDWFKLTAIGYDKDGNITDSTEFFLADFRFNDSAEDYIVKDWRWVDLSALGKVKSINFYLSSSDSGKWGMNTPAYFCFDNLNGKSPTSVATLDRVGENITVFPNPVKDVLFVKTKKPLRHISVRNVAGITVKELEAFSATNIYEINFTDLASGIYFIIFDDGQNQVIKKVIK